MLMITYFHRFLFDGFHLKLFYLLNFLNNLSGQKFESLSYIDSQSSTGLQIAHSLLFGKLKRLSHWYLLIFHITFIPQKQEYLK